MRVRFHLPDFSGHFKFNMVFTKLLETNPELFREGVEIASFYGVFPPSIWNGGRASVGACDKKFVQVVLNSFNRQGIPLRFTFTNPALEKKHLNDEFCNMVLHMADNGLNEVIVVSPMLEEYIRKNYPNYKITSSTCKRITDSDALANELENDYHIVVLDYDLNNKYDILEKIPHKEKCELLVNSNCIPGCPKRVKHYYQIGLQQIAYTNHVKKYPNVPFNLETFNKKYTAMETSDCPYMSRIITEIKETSAHIKPDDIYNKYAPMGFEQFKIEGRTASIPNLMETYLYYMVKPECIDTVRFKFLHLLAMNDVIVFNE